MSASLQDTVKFFISTSEKSYPWIPCKVKIWFVPSSFRLNSSWDILKQNHWSLCLRHNKAQLYFSPPAQDQKNFVWTSKFFSFYSELYKNKFKNLIWTSKFKFSFQGLNYLCMHCSFAPQHYRCQYFHSISLSRINNQYYNIIIYESKLK